MNAIQINARTKGCGMSRRALFLMDRNITVAAITKGTKVHCLDTRHEGGTLVSPVT